MIKAIIKKANLTPYEVAVYGEGRLMAIIRCIDYEVDDGMIIFDHGDYNSYVHCDEYTCETWKD